MPDDLNTRGGRDRERINVNQEHELRYWAEKFGVSHEQIKTAVAAVGDSAEKVREYLAAPREHASS
jgi:hypothetical protein